MTERQLLSKRKNFTKADLHPTLYDTLMGVFGKHLVALEPGAAPFVKDPERLKEVYAMMKDAWTDTLYPADQPALDYALIPLDHLYSLPGYLTALLECWHNWTMPTTANAISFVKQHPELQQDCVVVADGFGASAVMWAIAFPNNVVTAHIMGSAATDLFNFISAELNLPNLKFTAVPVTAPVVLAFECFEHFYEPFDFAEPFLKECKFLAHASPWTVPAHGHFREYRVDGVVVPNTEVSRLFSKWLKQLGFTNTARTHNFRHFNGRPEQYTRA